VQDEDGFMWFATTNGLDRYDGYKIVAYRNDPSNPDSLSGNFINAMALDRAGTLWLGTGTGLSALDRSTGHFTRYLSDPDDPQTISGNTVMAIHEDSSGVLWVGTTTGLNSLDRSTGRFTHYLSDPDDLQTISDNQILVVYEDRAGVFWIGTNRGLNRLDRSTGHFTRYLNDPANPRSLSYNSVWDIYEDHAGSLWMTTDGGGLNRLDRETGIFDQFRHDPKDPHSLSVDRLDSLYEDASGALWLGTFGGGLNILDPARRTFTVYQQDPATSTSLSNNSVTTIYEDRSDLLWLGTIGGGIDTYNPRQQAFTVYLHDPDVPTSVGSSSINSVFEDRNGALWVGTRNAGLDKFVPAVPGEFGRGGEFTHYPPDPANPRALGFPYVRALLQDTKGTMWVGSYGDGLYRFDLDTGVFTRYRNDPADPRSLTENRVNDLVEDDDGQIWVATFGGLNRFDPVSGTFTSYLNDPSDPNTVSSDQIWSVTRDQRGNIWIGTRGAGLNRLDPATGKVTRYRHDPNNPASLSDDSVDAVLIDRSGVVWAGMFGGGVDRLNPEDGTFTHYRERAGLSSDEVLSIMEDGMSGDPAGNIWVVTGHGVSRIDQDRKGIRNYDTSDGLPATQYTFAHHVTRTGALLIGSEQGLVVFDPATLHDDTTPPQVAFTDFLVENNPVPIAPDSPLQQTINDADAVQLSYENRVISFEFAALSYSAPERNRYRYKLDGFDRDWTEVDSSRRLVTYTNLDPGRYTFHVTASNGDGVWNDTGRQLSMLITPPWWETMWFQGAAALLVVGGLFGAYRFRVSNLHSRQRTLEQAIEQRTADLAQANSALQTENAERTEAEQALVQANSALRQRIGELWALNEITQVLANSTDLEVALQTVGNTIAGMFGETCVGIWLLDDSRLSVSRVVAATNYRTITETDVVLLDDDSVAQQLVAHPQTRVIDRSCGDSIIAKPPHLPVGDDAGRCMLLPLLSRGDVIGLFCIRATTLAHIFTSADAALAQTVAGSLANAIENTRLFSEAQTAAAEDERRRIARDLHDSVSQSLFAANLTAEVLPSLLERDPAQGNKSLHDLHRFTSSALAEMRTLLVELRPKAIVDTPLHQLLHTLVKAISARSHASVDEQIRPAPHLPPDVKIVFYRLAQEALNNTIRHADAQHIRVILHFTPTAPEEDKQEHWNGKAEMVISDDGRGFNPAEAAHGGLGLDNMRERAAGIQADLVIASTPGEGTQILVTWTGSSIKHSEDKK
jgi:signal transduction histidine kinase/ligand-binding sensor domain-containing protein